MSGNLRRRRPNYLLPTESIDVLRGLIGRSIEGLAVGLRSVDDEVRFQREVRRIEDVVSVARGMPYFISTCAGRVVVLYDDDLMGSLVLREFYYDIDEPDFLDVLESEDKVGERVRVRKLCSLKAFVGYQGKVIQSVCIHKLPKNYYYTPNGYDMIGECIIRIFFSSNEGIVFAGKVRGGVGFPDIRIVDWCDLEPHDRTALKCVWSSD